MMCVRVGVEGKYKENGVKVWILENHKEESILNYVLDKGGNKLL